MKNIFTIFLLSMMSVSFCAEEPLKTYVGAFYHRGTYDETDAPKATLPGIGLNIGKQLNKNISIQANFIFGSGKDVVDFNGIDVDVKLVNALSIFIKGDYPISEASRVYGLLGYTQGKIAASAGTIKTSVEDEGISYGFGIELDLQHEMAVYLEHVTYIVEEFYDYRGINIGLKTSFN